MKCFLIISSTVIMLLLACVALADGVSLETALSMVGQADCPAMIELNDDFKHLSLLDSEEYELNEDKFIILQRVAPLKSYDVFSAPLADDFEGNDIGEYKTYLCAEKMLAIPEELRLAAVEEIGNVLMAETYYVPSGEISGTVGGGIGHEASEIILNLILEGKEEEAAALMALERMNNPPVYNYKPVFDGYALLSIYNWEDGSCLPLDYRVYPHRELRDNPEADDLWSIIEALISIKEAADSQDPAELEAAIDQAEYVLEEEEPKLLRSFTPEQCSLYCEKNILFYAGLMAKADGDEETVELYDRAIEIRSIDGISYIAYSRGYNSVSMDDERIESSRAYIGEVDPDELVDMPDEMIEALSDESVQWSPLILYYLLLLS